MFAFYRTRHKYRETKAAHSSPNEFRDPLRSLWNQARAGPFRPFREYLTQKLIVPGVKEHYLVKVQHMIVSEESSYIANGGMTNSRGGS